MTLTLCVGTHSAAGGRAETRGRRSLSSGPSACPRTARKQPKTMTSFKQLQFLEGL